MDSMNQNLIDNQKIEKEIFVLFSRIAMCTENIRGVPQKVSLFELLF